MLHLIKKSCLVALVLISCTYARISIDTSRLPETIQKAVRNTAIKLLAKRLPNSSVQELLNFVHLQLNPSLIKSMYENNTIKDFEKFTEKLTAESQQFLTQFGESIQEIVNKTIEPVAREFEQKVQEKNLSAQGSRDYLKQINIQELILVVLYDEIYTYAKEKNLLISMFNEKGLVPVAKRVKSITTPEALLPKVLELIESKENMMVEQITALASLSPEEQKALLFENFKEYVQQMSTDEKAMALEQIKAQLANANSEEEKDFLNKMIAFL